MDLQLQLEDFEDFSEFSDSSFKLEENFQISKDILSELMSQNRNNKCDFEFDEWRIQDLRDDYSAIFDFNEIDNALSFYKHIDKKTFVEVIKCWIATNLSSITSKRVRDSYTVIIDFIKISRCFDESSDTIDMVTEHLKELEPGPRYIKCLFVLNFLNYYEELDDNGYYSGLLISIKDSISHKDLANVRILPKTKDLLIFNIVLNNYFSKIKIDNPNYLLYFPILLWWRLTTIIPLRPFEFCSIKRNALEIENGNHFIYLPRSGAKGKKPSNKHNIQIPDKIPISEELYQLFLTYKENTDIFGETETLLSHKSIVAYRIKGRTRMRFPYSALRRLLIRFYDEVVENEYSLSIRPWDEQVKDRKIFNQTENKLNKELLQIVKNDEQDSFDIYRQLRLGDTRHIALLNMQRLGYHPVEMARFAGHTNLRTQYHYHSHQLKWVDTEVLKLMTDLNLKKIREIDDTSPLTSFTATDIKEDYNTDREWKDKFVLKSLPFERLDQGKKLNLGKCYDKNQLCPVDDCAKGCDYWRISIEEYHEKKEIIIEKIKAAESRLTYVVTSLVNLHDYAISNQNDPTVSVDNLRFNSELLSKSKEIDECIAQLAELKTIEERRTIHGKQRETLPSRHN
ncbi:hypothetical protein ACFWDG_18800 [Peribacillus sp. NPDC060186]